MYNFTTYPIKYGEDRNSTVSNEFDVSDPDFINLMTCGKLCLRAEFEGDSTEPVLNRNVEGDASEAAILKCVECISPNVKQFRDANPKLMEVPFNSTNKYQVNYFKRFEMMLILIKYLRFLKILWQLSIHKTANGNMLFMKGAPEKILQLCSTVSSGGRGRNLTDDAKEQINAILTEMGKKGERVLGTLPFWKCHRPTSNGNPYVVFFVHLRILRLCIKR